MKTLNFYWKFYFIFHSLRYTFLCKHIHEVILHLICPKPMIFFIVLFVDSEFFPSYYFLLLYVNGIDIQPRQRSSIHTALKKQRRWEETNERDK